jgi:hypothetical protein
MTPALIALALATLADVVTTLRGLKRGAREANPVSAALMRRGVWAWVLARSLVAVGVAVWGVSAGQTWLLWLIAGLTAVVAWHNTKQGRRG